MQQCLSYYFYFYYYYFIINTHDVEGAHLTCLKHYPIVYILVAPIDKKKDKNRLVVVHSTLALCFSS